MRQVRLEASRVWIVTALGCAAAIAAVGGCGSSDTRPVKAPPVQADVQPDLAPHTSSSASAAASSSAAAAAIAAPVPSAQQLKADLVRSTTEIDRVLATLGTLTNPQTPPSQLRPAFDAYSDQLARMTQNSEQMKREAGRMRDARAAYFARWEQKASQIDNPSIRASAEERKSRLRAAQERITTSALAARDAYEPFMRDLQDVRKYLATDLSPASVQVLGDVSRKANADGAVVKERINSVIAELDSVEAGAPG